MTVHQKLVETRPNFHRSDPVKGPLGWALERTALERLDQLIKPHFRCLETGSGWSSCVMLERAKSLVTIDPNEYKFPLVREWMTEHSFERHLERWHTIPLPSFDAWRIINSHVTEPLDLVLIDGLHSFPVVEIDWFYSSLLLRPGGLMVLDDLRIWSVKVLVEMLKQDTSWKVIWQNDKTAILRLTETFRPNRSHASQPFVVARSTGRHLRKKK